MTPLPRPAVAPRLVVGCWALSVLSGAALLAPHALSSTSSALEPATLDRYLARSAPPGSRDIRVNGVYGSGHGGAWQFVAHLTWRGVDGRVGGGTTTLPQRAGAPAAASDFDQTRLVAEESQGWTLSEIRRALGRVARTSDQFSMLSLEIPAGEPGRLTACHASDPRKASCTAQTRSGPVSTFSDTLTDQPALAALSVQRLSAPVVPASSRS